MPQKASSFHASIIQINNESHRIKISIPPIQPKTYSFKDASSLFVHHYFACTDLRTANFILAKKTILFSLLYAALVKIDSNQAKNPNNNNYHVKSIVLASHDNTEAFHSLNDLYDTFYCLSHQQYLLCPKMKRLLPKGVCPDRISFQQYVLVQKIIRRISIYLSKDLTLLLIIEGIIIFPKDTAVCAEEMTFLLFSK